jgi:hypothetical protein
MNQNDIATIIQKLSRWDELTVTVGALIGPAMFLPQEQWKLAENRIDEMNEEKRSIRCEIKELIAAERPGFWK